MLNGAYEASPLGKRFNSSFIHCSLSNQIDKSIVAVSIAIVAIVAIALLATPANATGERARHLRHLPLPFRTCRGWYVLLSNRFICAAIHAISAGMLMRLIANCRSQNETWIHMPPKTSHCIKSPTTRLRRGSIRSGSHHRKKFHLMCETETLLHLTTLQLHGSTPISLSTPTTRFLICPSLT